jgi:hypothetical protein
MANPSQIEQITERVDRLLVRYDELQRTNVLAGTTGGDADQRAGLPEIAPECGTGTD